MVLTLGWPDKGHQWPALGFPGQRKRKKEGKMTTTANLIEVYDKCYCLKNNVDLKMTFSTTVLPAPR